MFYQRNFTVFSRYVLSLMREFCMTNSRSITALIFGAATFISTPAFAFADATTAPATTAPATTASHTTKAANPAMVAYRAAMVQYRDALKARRAARVAANNALQTALAAAKTPADKKLARDAHKAAIAALPAIPVKPVKPTK